MEDGRYLNEPSPYHYKCVLENYKNGLDYILENYVNNESYKSEKELLGLAESSIKELKRREDLMEEYIKINQSVNIIKSSDFISQNYTDKLLFYSMNHPTPPVMQYVALKIKDILFLGEINYIFDGLSGNERGILYSCIQKCVNFALSLHIPRLSEYNIETTQDIICKYIATYENKSSFS